MKASGTAVLPPEELWSCFRIPIPERIQQIPSGYSSAILFRVQTASANWALKSNPNTDGRKERRWGFHQILRLAGAIAPNCIPVVPPISLVDFGGRIWELLPWIDGEHKLPGDLSPTQWHQAFLFLGHIHEALGNAGPRSTAPLRQTQSFQNRCKILEFAWGDLASGSLIWPEVFSTHQAWPVVLPRLKEMIRWSLEYLARDEKKIVGIQTIHGDPHLGNWLWRNGQPIGLVDFLGSFDCIESDFARLFGSHAMDPFESIRLVCSGFENGGSWRRCPDPGVCGTLLFSGLVATLFRWRNWFAEGRVSVSLASLRVNELLEKFPKAILWRQSRW